mmetsp:Transcript_58659/g.163702  ORF Transcript_58659/g.163702 Transcript_58659/m.163702 type:complete len:252 (+) Transcript_58659:2184-2939(+)
MRPDTAAIMVARADLQRLGAADLAKVVFPIGASHVSPLRASPTRIAARAPWLRLPLTFRDVSARFKRAGLGVASGGAILTMPRRAGNPTAALAEAARGVAAAPLPDRPRSCSVAVVLCPLGLNVLLGIGIMANALAMRAGQSHRDGLATGQKNRHVHQRGWHFEGDRFTAWHLDRHVRRQRYLRKRRNIWQFVRHAHRKRHLRRRHVRKLVGDLRQCLRNFLQLARDLAKLFFDLRHRQEQQEHHNQHQHC